MLERYYILKKSSRDKRGFPFRVLSDGRLEDITQNKTLHLQKIHISDPYIFYYVDLNTVNDVSNPCSIHQKDPLIIQLSSIDEQPKLLYAGRKDLALEETTEANARKLANSPDSWWGNHTFKES